MEDVPRSVVVLLCMPQFGMRAHLILYPTLFKYQLELTLFFVLIVNWGRWNTHTYIYMRMCVYYYAYIDPFYIEQCGLAPSLLTRRTRPFGPSVRYVVPLYMNLKKYFDMNFTYWRTKHRLEIGCQSFIMQPKRMWQSCR